MAMTAAPPPPRSNPRDNCCFTHINNKHACVTALLYVHALTALFLSRAKHPCIVVSPPNIRLPLELPLPPRSRAGAPPETMGVERRRAPVFGRRPLRNGYAAVLRATSSCDHHILPRALLLRVLPARAVPAADEIAAVAAVVAAGGAAGGTGPSAAIGVAFPVVLAPVTGTSRGMTRPRRRRP